MAVHTAGLFMCRKTAAGMEFLLVHPGGPYWAHKDAGAWSIPKGVVEANEDILAAAKREFKEETSLEPRGPYIALGSLKTRGGKILYAWAFFGDWDPATGITSNHIKIEYPYHSGKFISISEVDRAAWWSFDQAVIQINSSQKPLLVKANELMQAALNAHA